jgi:hypothetical protein
MCKMANSREASVVVRRNDTNEAHLPLAPMDPDRLLEMARALHNRPIKSTDIYGHVDAGVLRTATLAINDGQLSGSLELTASHPGVESTWRIPGIVVHAIEEQRPPLRPVEDA